MRLLLIPAILASSAALADPQTQAAALLSRSLTPVTMTVERTWSVPETSIDAHASAAALLSGQRAAHPVSIVSAVREPSAGRMPVDAHSRAAALLRGMGF